MKMSLAVLALFAAGVPAFTASVAIAQQPAATSSVSTAPCVVAEIKVNLSDWPALSRYQQENAALAPPAPQVKRVVFLGSSTIDNWGRHFDSVYFSGKPYVNRGISGQTTAQMLLRFQQDVVALQPAAVVFLGGTNDIAGNTGPMTLEDTERNIQAMAAIAQANGIKLILASQLPVKAFPWNKACRPEAKLLALSAWERRFATERHLGYVDLYGALAAADGSFKPGLSEDGVHPTKKAYELMAPVVQSVIGEIENEP